MKIGLGLGTRLHRYSARCIGILVLLLCGSLNSSDVYYSMNSADVYKWNRAYPQGCTCAQSDSTKKTCVLFKCECLCDLSAGICDYNCCCDPDCSTQQIARFKSLENGCEYDGSESYRVELCYSSVQLYGINPKGPIGGKSTSEAAVGQALCVEKYNTAIREEFYTDAAIESSSVFDTDIGTKSYSYIEQLSAQPLSDPNYDRNDSIAAFLTSSGSLISNGPGYFQLPISDETGSCNDQNYVTFENDVDGGTCSRTLSLVPELFISQCENQFSVERFVTTLSIGSSSTVTVTDDSVTSSQLVSVSLNSVLFEDYSHNGSPADGDDVTALWVANDCSTRGYLGHATPNSNCIFSAPNSTLDELTTAGGFCQGFVKSVSYTVTHDSSTAATIQAVSADIVISDVPMRTSSPSSSSSGSNSSSNTSSSSVTVSQSFSVRFISVGSTADISSNNGNLVQRLRSGNPGYVIGLPVLYGFYDSSVNAINELISGFMVPSSFAPYDANNPEVFGRAICPQTSSSAGQAAVQFGYDLLSGCTVELSREELLDMCCVGSGSCSGVSGSTYSSPYSDSSGMPYFLNFQTGYVGNYGDADPLDQSQWTEVSYEVSKDSRQWDDRLSTCRNMYTSLQIQFLVGWSGSRSNPQNKIISSSAQLTTSDWVMKIPPGDTRSRQAFPLSVVVSFVFREESSLQGYVAPPPPVLFQIPYDAFYPFISGEQSSGMRSATANVALCCAAVLSATWFLL